MISYLFHYTIPFFFWSMSIISCPQFPHHVWMTVCCRSFRTAYITSHHPHHIPITSPIAEWWSCSSVPLLFICMYIFCFGKPPITSLFLSYDGGLFRFGLVWFWLPSPRHAQKQWKALSVSLWCGEKKVSFCLTDDIREWKKDKRKNREGWKMGIMQKLLHNSKLFLPGRKGSEERTSAERMDGDMTLMIIIIMEQYNSRP